MKYAMTAAVLVAALAARAPGGDASADDLKKMQGTWKLVEVGGKAVTGEEAKARLVINGKKSTVFVGDRKITEGAFKLDAGKKPKQIDVAPETGGATKGTSLGIYELDGDTLRIMLGSEQVTDFDGKKEFVPSKRPKDFSDKSEPVMTFKRVQK